MPVRLSRIDYETLTRVANSFFPTDPRSTSLEDILNLYLRSFYTRKLSRKRIFENLGLVSQLSSDVSAGSLDTLVKNHLVMVTKESPLTAIATPTGLCTLYSYRDPDRAEEYSALVLEVLEEEVESKLALTLKTFVAAPLTEREVGALVFLLYNDSTSPSRGQSPQKVELKKSIDRIVQAFVTRTPTAGGTAHADGAPGRWYIGEANRKLANAIYIQRSQSFIRPDRLDRVLSALAHFAKAEPRQRMEERWRAFEVAFRREAPVLATNRVLFANDESKARAREVLLS